MKDTQLFDLIRRERERQTKGIELIASENYVSDQVLQAMGSVLTNKYAEGYPAHRYYGGCEVVDEVEDLARTRLKQLYNAAYVNVQPHSGAQANMAVFMACLKPGDTFMGLNLSHGGHLSHGSAVNFSGLVFNAIGYDLDEATGLVDYDDLERKNPNSSSPALQRIAASGTTNVSVRLPTRSVLSSWSIWRTPQVLSLPVC